MKATEVALNSFLSQTKTQFIIPVYQRNYDWKESECKQLLNDILEVGSKPGETHFIGSIVFIYDGVYSSTEVKQLVIIDGQQRLTTFSLLYMALFKFANKNGLEEKGNEIHETYILNKFVKEDSSKLKLKQSDVNAKAFNFLLTNNEPSNYGEYSKVIDNYTFFYQNINKENFETILAGINSLLFVEISLERGKDDPQRIFESLNSTGLELSQADLIRNYILMGLEPKKQVSVFNTYWEIIENNAKDLEKEESRVSDFIRDYLTFKTKKIPNKGKVYQEFRTRYSERNDDFYAKTLQELKDFSFHYNKLLNPEKETDKDLKRELNFIKRLEINVSFPFLVPVYEDFKQGLIDKDTLRNILKLVQSYAWRRFIVNLPTNALNKVFMTLYNDIDKNNYYPSLERALAKKKSSGRFPNNIEIQQALVYKDVYNINSKNSVYFLELLENHNNKEYVQINSSIITIEHIFPQNPDERWHTDLEEMEFGEIQGVYLNTIANLTLSGNNGSLGNKIFLEKKNMNKDGKEQGYLYSHLWLNRYLKEIDTWNIEHLQKRFTILLDRFFEIWTYPDVEIEEDTELDEDYTINNAPDPKYKKLDYFIFRDEKIVTGEVAKMYLHVMKVLYEENGSTFHHEDFKSQIGLSTDPNDLRTPSPISASYFIEMNIDNNSKFRRLKIVLEKFNCEDDLLINYSNKEFDELEEEITDRKYWDNNFGIDAMKLLDDVFKFLTEIDNGLDLNYNKRHIGLKKNNKGEHFLFFSPKKSFVRVGIALTDVPFWIEKLSANNFEIISIDKKSGRLKFRIYRNNIINNSEVLKEVFVSSYNAWMK